MRFIRGSGIGLVLVFLTIVLVVGGLFLLSIEQATIRYTKSDIQYNLENAVASSATALKLQNQSGSDFNALYEALKALSEGGVKEDKSTTASIMNYTYLDQKYNLSNFLVIDTDLAPQLFNHSLTMSLTDRQRDNLKSSSNNPHSIDPGIRLAIVRPNNPQVGEPSNTTYLLSSFVTLEDNTGKFTEGSKSTSSNASLTQLQKAVLPTNSKHSMELDVGTDFTQKVSQFSGVIAYIDDFRPLGVTRANLAGYKNDDYSLGVAKFSSIKNKASEDN